MKKPHHTLLGHWRIIWMALWDQEYIDLVEPGYIKIGNDGNSEFLFGVVSGGFYVNLDNAYFDSPWEGSQECDDACGTIDAILKKEELCGTITFLGGDESEFRAMRENSSSK